jgi:hypothetical protein
MKKPDLITVLRNHTPGNVTQWTFQQIHDGMEDYGKQMWNAALEWAAKNATVKNRIIGPKVHKVVDKESILKGKL